MDARRLATPPPAAGEDLMNLVMRAGKLLLENGAEVFRVQQTMDIIARSYGGRDVNIYVLTNANTRVMEQLGHAPALPFIDGYLVSAEERLMKPDPAIFELICERFGLDPADCLFVDDNEDNCIGARVAGMHAYHFTGDVEDLEANVRLLG